MRKMTAKINTTENKRTVEKNQWTQKWFSGNIKTKTDKPFC